MQQAEASLQLLAVHVGASAGAEPRLTAEVHVVDNEAVATGVCIQDVRLPSTGTHVNRGLPALSRQESGKAAPGFQWGGGQSGAVRQERGLPCL